MTVIQLNVLLDGTEGLSSGSAVMWNCSGCNVKKRTFRETEERHAGRRISSVMTSFWTHTWNTRTTISTSN